MAQSSRSQRFTLAGPRTIALALALALSTVSGCQVVADSGPVPEDVSFDYLERELSSALEEISSLNCVLQDSVQLEGSTSAQRAVLRLRDYYVPLMEALVRADRASRRVQLGEDDVALEELALIESKLLSVSDLGDLKLSEEIDRPLEFVVTARAAIRAHRSDAPQLIRHLRARIDQLLHKGGLVLQGTSLEPPR